ncbi:collagen alpha-1(XXI) chain-like [Ylistrum balloti]|uniref:collagen alpha-1(XXI) chain-like n=1 Tax=Ylistrum balloti TaxID=509963 RepID=UPI0029059869|nr:collagen alpha-1(XXI) chain-like [Ylistrum balloti]
MSQTHHNLPVSCESSSEETPIGYLTRSGIDLLYVCIILQIAGASSLPLDKREDKWCDGNPADIFFLIDSSTSIWGKDFRIQRRFLQDLVKCFPIGPTAMRVGLALFSDRYYRVIRFNQYDNTKKLQRAIGRIPHIYGSTYTGIALRSLRTREFTRARKNVTKIAVVLTDGASHDESMTARQAELLKKSGVFVFAVGIGTKSKLSELKKIGSTPSEQFVFSVAGYHLLNEIREALAFKACRVAPVLPYCAARRPTDVMFGFDSAAMGTYRSAHVRNMIANVSGYFGNMNDGTLQAGIFRGLCDEKDIPLNEYKSKEDFVSDLQNSTNEGARDILKDVKDMGYAKENGGREKARKITVLFIDESTPDLNKIIEEIVQARSMDIEVFVVAIGTDLDLVDLIDVLDTPTEEHLVTVPTHKDLDTIHASYSDLLCDNIEEEPTPTPTK